MNDNEKFPRTFALLKRLTNPTNGMVYECVSFEFAKQLEGETQSLRLSYVASADFARELERTNDKLRDELFAAQSAVSVKDKALSRLYCAEMASKGTDFSAAIQAEIEDAMKQAKKAINNPLTP